MNDDERWITVTDAAKLLGIYRQGVVAAIQKGRIPAQKNHLGFWIMRMKDVVRYDETKYIREETLLMNKEKVYACGKMSVKQAAEYLGMSVQNVYYLIRSGKLNVSRFGRQTVITQEDAESYLKNAGVRSSSLINMIIS
jgi:excisionase family DNA binding protein